VKGFTGLLRRFWVMVVVVAEGGTRVVVEDIRAMADIMVEGGMIEGGEGAVVVVDVVEGGIRVIGRVITRMITVEMVGLRTNKGC
jgi:hypothetical protein